MPPSSSFFRQTFAFFLRRIFTGPFLLVGNEIMLARVLQTVGRRQRHRQRRPLNVCVHKRWPLYLINASNWSQQSIQSTDRREQRNDGDEQRAKREFPESAADDQVRIDRFCCRSFRLPLPEPRKQTNARRERKNRGKLAARGRKERTLSLQNLIAINRIIRSRSQSRHNLAEADIKSTAVQK